MPIVKLNDKKIDTFETETSLEKTEINGVNGKLSCKH